jgi:hypothetical protein
MLAATSLICADEPAPDLICSVCLDTWRTPVELKPCSHIFCSECIHHVPPIVKCPECRCYIEAFKAPNRVLTRLAEQVKVKCGGCQWKGTREESVGHRCFVAPKAPVPPTVKLHTVSEAVAKQLATYFIAFGGDAGSTAKGGDVTITKKGFFELMKCFHYGDSKEDLDKIYNAVRNVTPPPPRDGSVTVRSLCTFLAKYPAEPKRLYKLSLEDYHTCMYSLYEWFEKRKDATSLLPRDEQKFSGKEFIEFAILHKYLAPFESPREQKRAEGHWMSMVDVVDRDGMVSRHEALRFMSSCIRVSSLRDDNFEEHLCDIGDVAASPQLRRGGDSNCCSMQ